MKIEDIIFDEDDKTLFLIDDLQLKADAIRYSILPKLEIINNELIARLTEFYSFNFFEHYSVGKTPHFRLAKTQRKEQTKTDYTYSAVSVTGQRKDDKWKGLDKGTGIVPKISPTSLSIDLTTDGLSTTFFFNHPKNFTKETYEKFYDLFINELNFILGLSTRAGLKYRFLFINTFSILQDLKLRLISEEYDFLLYSTAADYPISYEKINEVIYSNILLFPLLNACIEIALGNKPDIEADIEKLSEHIDEYQEKYFPGETVKGTQKIISEDELAEIKIKADTKIKVQAGVRWQVFKRDNWKCVACGRDAEENILHIDHILPRSKGGKDVIDNYQTLCETCNIGKSNKDDTDLRKRQ